jgi:hypothetical protein
MGVVTPEMMERSFLATRPQLPEDRERQDEFHFPAEWRRERPTIRYICIEGGKKKKEEHSFPETCPSLHSSFLAIL